MDPLHSCSKLTHARSGFTWGTTVPVIAYTRAESSVCAAGGYEAVVRRGRDESRTGRGLLTPTPARFSLLARLLARWTTLTRQRPRSLAEAPSARETEVASVSDSPRP